MINLTGPTVRLQVGRVVRCAHFQSPRSVVSSRCVTQAAAIKKVEQLLEESATTGQLWRKPQY